MLEFLCQQRDALAFNLGVRGVDKREGEQSNHFALHFFLTQYFPTGLLCWLFQYLDQDILHYVTVFSKNRGNANSLLM